ncbi:uncharacterized protein LOC143912848 [Arctopsyche grandis]|uniref:uncharacterized protein LOC143912848 n=1 Tax=Arctopsyche grandis TaxID=121162 RepID=UPI00406D8FE4
MRLQLRRPPNMTAVNVNVNELDVLDNWEEVDDSQLERVWSRAAAPPSAAPALPLALPLPLPQAHAPLPLPLPLPMSEQLFSMAGAVPAPAVRILKRPGAGGARPSPGGGGPAPGEPPVESRNRPVRTLQQRQQEYEAARLRILGQARCPDDTEHTAPTVQIKIDNNRLVNVNKPKEKQNEQMPTLLHNNIVSVQPRIVNQNQTNGISLLRTPKGPDNSRGFNLRR